MEKYKKDTILGAKWSFISQFGRQLALFLTTVILVRLLSPSDFGLMGMATVVIGFIEVFTNFGISAAIIQRNDISDSFLSTLFWVSFGFGILILVTLYFAAPLAELYFKEPRVTPIIRALGLNFFVLSSCATHRALLEKRLAFKLLAKLEISAIILGSIFGISAAFLGQGVWSLVIQSMARMFSTALLLWIFISYRPSFIFSFYEIKEILSFSLHLTSFNITNYILRNADYLIIGRFLGVQALGYYTLGYKLMLFPVKNFSSVIGRVLFPVYSKIQYDNQKIGELVLKTASITGFIIIPLMFGVMAVANPLTLSIFGKKWEASIPIILILAPVGLIQSISVPSNLILLAKGRTDIMFYWGLFSGTIMVISYSIGLRWGITGVAASYAISGLFLLYPSLAIRFRLIKLTVTKLIIDLYKSFFIGIFMAASITIINYFLLEGLNYYMQLGILLPFGAMCYLFISILFNKNQIHEFLRLIKIAAKAGEL